MPHVADGRSRMEPVTGGGFLYGGRCDECRVEAVAVEVVVVDAVLLVVVCFPVTADGAMPVEWFAVPVGECHGPECNRVAVNCWWRSLVWSPLASGPSKRHIRM